MTRVIKNGRLLKTKPSQLRANQRYYAKNRDKLKAQALQRYHESKGA
jgi:hypothetical protein